MDEDARGLIKDEREHEGEEEDQARQDMRKG